jgi:hypothetical protein
MSNTLGYINLFLIIGLFIFLIIVVFSGRRQEFAITNVAWVVQEGTSSATTENMATGGNNLYIAQSSSALSLTVLPSNTNTIGRQIMIKNTTNNVVTVVAGSGVTITGSGTVAASDYGLYVVRGATNSFIRINE